MVLDKKLTKFSTASPVIQSVSFTEIVSGLGFIRLFGYETINNTTKSYILSSQVEYSNNIETTGATDIALEFDSSTFNITRTVDGTVTLSISFAVTGFRDEYSGHVLASLFHVDKDNNESQLGSTQRTEAVGDDPAGDTTTTTAGNSTVKFDDINQIFRVGDLVRLKLTTVSLGTNRQGSIAHSPKNIDGSFVSTANGATNTQLIIDLPVKTE